MIEELLVNPYAGDGTKHPDMHLIYVEQICGLFKLAGCYLLSMRWFSLEEERVMQQSRINIPLSF